MPVLISHTHSIFSKVFLTLSVLFAYTVVSVLVSSHLSFDPGDLSSFVYVCLFCTACILGLS
jgi:hypothetical protein